MKIYSCRKPLLMLLIIWVYCSGFVSGQSIVKDTAAIDELYNKSKNYWRSNYDSAYYYLKQADQQSTEYITKEVRPMCNMDMA